MTDYKVIDVDEKGLFVSDPDKFFYLDKGTSVLFRFTGAVSEERVVFFITDHQNTGNKKTRWEPDDGKTLGLAELKEKYNVLEGSYRLLHSWTCAVVFTEAKTFDFQLMFAAPAGEGGALSVAAAAFTSRLIVNPELTVAPGARPLTFDGATVMTVFPSMMGNVSTWEAELRFLITQRGYSGFHFCPIQELGLSHSLYCLGDFERPNPRLFGHNQDFSTLREIFDRLRREHSCVFMIDMVFNHCAADAPWLPAEPGAYYSPRNTPRLNVAYALDRALADLSLRFNELELVPGNKIHDAGDVDAVVAHIRDKVLPSLNIKSYFVTDIAKTIAELERHIIAAGGEALPPFSSKLEFVERSQLDSLARVARDAGRAPQGVVFEPAELHAALREHFTAFGRLEVEKILFYLNTLFVKRACGWEADLLRSIEEELRGRFLSADRAIKTAAVSAAYPLLAPFFIELPNGDAAACNGWVGEYAEPVDFIASAENYYLRRRVSIWSDLIKLRFAAPAEAPELWRKATRYAEQMAETFDAFRLDNFHNSHLPAAVEFITAAKARNPDLLVMAELFLPEPSLFRKYLTEGGVHWFLGELHHSRSARDVLALCQRGFPDLKSQRAVPPADALRVAGGSLTMQHGRLPTMLYYDKTHDNDPLFKTFKTCAMQLPLAAFIAFLGSPVGTTRGCDELWTRFVHVTEQAPYPPQELRVAPVPSEHALLVVRPDSFIGFGGEAHFVFARGNFNNWERGLPMEKNALGDYCVRVSFLRRLEFKFYVNNASWHCSADYAVENADAHTQNNVYAPDRESLLHADAVSSRAAFNRLHAELNVGFPLTRVVAHDAETLIVQRFDERCRAGYTLVCGLNYDPATAARPTSLTATLEGQVAELQAVFSVQDGFEEESAGDFPRLKLRILEERRSSEYICLPRAREGDSARLQQRVAISGIPANFAVVMKSAMPEFVPRTVEELEKSLLAPPDGGLAALFAALSLADVNYYLYSCEAEERARFGDAGCYVVPVAGALPFAGFAGLRKMLEDMSMRQKEDHPLYAHLMAADDLIDFHRLRLERREGHPALLAFYSAAAGKIKSLPRFLVPKYFHALASLLLRGIEGAFVARLAVPAQLAGNAFFARLARSLPQFLTAAAKPPAESGAAGFYAAHALCLPSAGLPFFAVGCWKNWGRDTFISFKGLFLATGLLAEGRMVLLHYARYLRHGLIPNLLEPARYNCRDAVWWFVKSVGDYVEAAGAPDLLAEPVDLIYLSDDAAEHARRRDRGESESASLLDVLQRIFQSHCAGIKFREWNAPAIDGDLSDEGFNVSLRVDWFTGFVSGGSRFNCLTWMDKMGSSARARNKGVPATPRFGAPIELSALLYLGVRLMARLHKRGLSPHAGVRLNEGRLMSYSVWKAQLQGNFERFYWVPEEPKDSSLPELDEQIVEEAKVIRRGIYRDCYSGAKEDYKLRPNALVALALVPELLTPRNMQLHLEQSGALLTPASVGVKTLDPRDEAYRPDYQLDDESADFATAHGFNYHNGPEWLWLHGYYVMAGYNVYERMRADADKHQIATWRKHYDLLNQSDWFSLPELTNAGGRHCAFSCRSQLWTTATIIEALAFAKKRV